MAALWTLFFAWQFRAHLPVAAPLALAVAVWVLYVADRVQDAVRGDLIQDRHRFHLRHTQPLLIATIAGCCTVLTLLFFLPMPLRTAWLLLALPLALYVCAVHMLRLDRVPKEPLVAVFFAAATAMPVYVSHGAMGLRVPLAALSFGLVCWLNCAAIGRWEGMLALADPLTRWLGTHLQRGAWIIALLMVPAIFVYGGSAVAVAVLAAVACLVQLHGRRARLHPATLRALADVALLTPLVVWPVSAWLRL